MLQFINYVLVAINDAKTNKKPSKLENAQQAVNSLNNLSEKKLQIKQNYYERKLDILNRQLKISERQLYATERVANALEKYINQHNL